MSRLRSGERMWLAFLGWRVLIFSLLVFGFRVADNDAFGAVLSGVGVIVGLMLLILFSGEAER